MRLGIGDSAIGFWFSQTTHGISMGPIVPGKEHVHLTFFMNGEVFNAHLKIVENGKSQYKNLTVMNPHQFQQRLKQTATNILNSLGPANPNQDAILISDQGQKLFQKLAGGSLTTTYKGKTGYIDFDLGIIVNEIQDLLENPIEFFSPGKAHDLIGRNPFTFGLTEAGAPIFPINNQIYSWGTTSWEKTISNLTGIIGIPQLFSEIEKRKLFQKWRNKNRPQLEHTFLRAHNHSFL